MLLSDCLTLLLQVSHNKWGHRHELLSIESFRFFSALLRVCSFSPAPAKPSSTHSPPHNSSVFHCYSDQPLISSILLDEMGSASSPVFGFGSFHRRMPLLLPISLAPLVSDGMLALYAVGRAGRAIPIFP